MYIYRVDGSALCTRVLLISFFFFCDPKPPLDNVVVDRLRSHVNISFLFEIGGFLIFFLKLYLQFFNHHQFWQWIRKILNL